MTDIDENLEGAFGDSRKNNFDENSDFNLELEINALLEAKKLRQYVDTKEMEKLSHRTLIIHTRVGNKLKFQATLVRFLRHNGEVCKAEFSVPIGFKGAIRLWTEDLRGKKVWSTMDRIVEHKCNPNILFDFLGKYTHRYTEQEMSDDLPF